MQKMNSETTVQGG